MPLQNYTKLKGLTDVSKTDLLTEIETNLKYWIDWALLGAGGWIDVNIPQTGIYGGSEHVLRYVNDSSYTNGKVWEGFRKDWVWETGVEHAEEPISITGVQISGVNYPSGHSTYGWHINYPNGRIIFNNAVATGASVQANYSYRWCQTYVADEAPWWTELQYNSFHAEDDHFIQSTQRGDWSIGPHHRIQMPSVVIECVPRGSARGYELGNSALTIEQDVLLHAIAENRQDRNKLVDYFRGQKDKSFYLFNSDDVVAATGFPLDYRGMRTGSNMYPDLVADTGDGGYRWKIAYIMGAVISEVESFSSNLHEGTVRLSLELVKGDI